MNVLQERARERITAAIPAVSLVVDPDRPATRTMILYQVWDRSGRDRGRLAVNGAGEFVGGTVWLFGASKHTLEGYDDLTAFVAALLMVGGW